VITLVPGPPPPTGWGMAPPPPPTHPPNFARNNSTKLATLVFGVRGPSKGQANPQVNSFLGVCLLTRSWRTEASNRHLCSTVHIESWERLTAPLEQFFPRRVAPPRPRERPV